MRPTLGRWRLGHPLGDSPRGSLWLATDGTRDVVLWDFNGWVSSHSESDRRLERLCRIWTGAAAPWLVPSLEYGEHPWVTMPFFASLGFGELCRAALFAGIETPLALQPVLALAESLARSPDLVESFATVVTQSTVRIGFDGELRAGPDPLRALEAWDEGLRLDNMTPPELFDRGIASSASAVWKLGVLALYALEGGDPLRDDPRPLVRAKPRVSREGRAQWPQPLVELLEASISPDPAQRPSLVELADRLRPHTAGPAAAAQWRAEIIARMRPEAERTQRLQHDALHDRPLEPVPEELEEKLLLTPDDPDLWLVVADWLESQGHPRGQLAALQRKLQQNAGDDGIEQLVERLVQRPDLAPQPPDDGPFEVEWGHHGWVDELLGLGAADAWTIERVLRHPGLRYLRRVALPLHHPNPEPWVEALCAVQPPLLKRVEVTHISATQKMRLRDTFLGLELIQRTPPTVARPGRPPRINLTSAAPPPPAGLFTRFFERLRGR
ncbi:MAG: hypothetical protein QM723_21630 [Myxococcaceae bacterium]